ncbi:holo-[acyl-carrier protein] synthase [Lachnospiraceae bacterium KM106-2]|nr:holo-[acyl-carrier protein] synthase [Lachnospiraceae bacterium KM106-2]
MIIGIGTDLIEVERVVNACNREHFLKRCFTEKEIELIQIDKKKAAGNFAVKEAVVKMFGTGFGTIGPVDIEVLRNQEGKPYVQLYGKAKEMAKSLAIGRIHVSITNTKEYASAFVVGESER